MDDDLRQWMQGYDDAARDWDNRVPKADTRGKHPQYIGGYNESWSIKNKRDVADRYDDVDFPAMFFDPKSVANAVSDL